MSTAFSEMRDNWPNDPTAAKQWLEHQIRRMETEGVFAEVISLTPALAHEFRERNADNRSIRVAKLKQMTSDILAGRYVLNGETVIFADTGQMNDGQHRCQAVIETMRAVDTVIVFGVSRDSRRTVDTGVNRGPGDVLAIEGFAYTHEMAAITRFILAWERNQKANLNAMNAISSGAIVKRAMEDKAIEQSAAWASALYVKTRAKVAAPSTIGFCYYAFRQVDEQAAEQFLKGVVQGIGLPADSAAYQIREILLALGYRRITREWRVEYLFAGFAAYLAGQPLGNYKIRTGLAALPAPAGAVNGHWGGGS